MAAIIVHRPEDVPNSIHTGRSLMYPGLAHRSLPLFAVEAEEKAAARELLASVRRLPPSGAVRPVDGGEEMVKTRSDGQSSKLREQGH